MTVILGLTIYVTARNFSELTIFFSVLLKADLYTA